ncbi:hypothetical protein [Desulfallas sp. Bu1-1]|jgi:hypothetical protein|nr:hypothetical protein [Desulfallas sp. Bu1-1]
MDGRKNDREEKMDLFFTSERLEDYIALAVSALILILVLLFF